MNDIESVHLDLPVTSAEMRRTLTNRKAQGKGGMTNEIKRAIFPEMCNVLNKLFHVIINTRLNPDSWKTGEKSLSIKAGTIQTLVATSESH